MRSCGFRVLSKRAARFLFTHTGIRTVLFAIDLPVTSPAKLFHTSDAGIGSCIGVPMDPFRTAIPFEFLIFPFKDAPSSQHPSCSWCTSSRHRLLPAHIIALVYNSYTEVSRKIWDRSCQRRHAGTHHRIGMASPAKLTPGMVPRPGADVITGNPASPTDTHSNPGLPLFSFQQQTVRRGFPAQFRKVSNPLVSALVQTFSPEESRSAGAISRFRSPRGQSRLH